MDIDTIRDSIRGFIRRLVPRDLIAYIPGPKLLAGIILYVLLQVFGIGADQVVDLPGVGSITVGALALLVGYYFWPESDDPEIEAALGAEFVDDIEIDAEPSDNGEMPSQDQGYPDQKPPDQSDS